MVLLLVMVAQLAGRAPAVAQGASASDSDETIESLREHIQEASAEEGRLLEQIEGASARKAELDAKVGAIDRDIGGVQAQLDTAEARLAALESRQQAVEAELAATQVELDEAKAQLGRQAISAYTGQTEAARWAEMLLESKTLAELAAKRTYLKAAAGSQAETIALTERLRDDVADLRNEVDGARGEAEGQRDVVAGQRNQLQASRSAQEGVRGQVATEVGTLDQARGEIISRKEEFEAEVRQMEEESAAIAATLREVQASSAPAQGDTSGGDSAGGGGDTSAGGGEQAGGGSAAPSGGSGGLTSPIPGASITSGFGSRVHPIYGTVRMHTGVDMGASTGTAIRSAGDGVVVSAGSQSGYGNTTVIGHGGGLATLYAHQSSIGVSTGQRVSQGEVIGRVGCTGACTGPHLHFEVRVNGTPVDPSSYI